MNETQINLWWDEDDEGNGQWFVAIYIDGAWDANADVPATIQAESDAIAWCEKSWPKAIVSVVETV